MKTYANLTSVPVPGNITSDVSVEEDSGSSYRPKNNYKSSESQSSDITYNYILPESPAELKSDQSIVNDESLSEHEQPCSQIEATMSSQ